MAEERADALIELGADDVFEFAGLIVGFGVFDGESVFEEALGETMTADDVAGAAGACVGEFDVTVKRLDELRFDHAAEHSRGRFVGDQRQAACGSGRLESIDAGGLPFFAEDPDLFE